MGIRVSQTGERMTKSFGHCSLSLACSSCKPGCHCNILQPKQGHKLVPNVALTQLDHWSKTVGIGISMSLRPICWVGTGPWPLGLAATTFMVFPVTTIGSASDSWYVVVLAWILRSSHGNIWQCIRITVSICFPCFSYFSESDALMVCFGAVSPWGLLNAAMASAAADVALCNAVCTTCEAGQAHGSTGHRKRCEVGIKYYPVYIIYINIYIYVIYNYIN